LIAAVALTALLVLAFVGAAVLTAGDDGGETRRPQSRETTTAPDSTTTETTSEQQVDGVALADEGFALLQTGDYTGALPLLRAAVLALKGSGVLTEAYASYNLAYARFATRRCDGVIGLLDRSERIQGTRAAIDELRRRWEVRCSSSAAEAEGDGDGRPAKGHSRGKGKGKDD
jgi:hypothetical protein